MRQRVRDLLLGVREAFCRVSGRFSARCQGGCLLGISKPSARHQGGLLHARHRGGFLLGVRESFARRQGGFLLCVRETFCWMLGRLSAGCQGSFLPDVREVFC
jgi:hypothetical protein